MFGYLDNIGFVWKFSLRRFVFGALSFLEPGTAAASARLSACHRAVALPRHGAGADARGRGAAPSKAERNA